mmetsp:Transcript_107566/g.343173  ORF Transcript_107566/g.343173 Transcript_107566/m.343173 type:complete len:241 (+) Transcript_107566:565-1287(+)
MVPWLPFSVTQPSLPSRTDLNRFLLMSPPSSSWPLMTSSASPTSTFLNTLQFLMSKLSVIAMVDLHMYKFLLGEANVLPAVSCSVTQPTLPSLLATAWSACSDGPCRGRGPSNNSKTSSCCISRTTDASVSKLCSNGAAESANKNGFSLGFSSGGPSPTLKVTQPAAPSRSARPRTRSTAPSAAGPSRTSKSSPFSNFRTVGAAAASKLEAISVLRSQMQNSCSAFAKPGFRRPWRPNSL